MSQRTPFPFSGREPTEDGEGGGVEVGSSKDCGRLAGITDDFRIVIEGDGVRNEVGAETTRDQQCGIAWRGLGVPLREIHGCGRSRRTPAILAATGPSGHSTTRSQGFISYQRDDIKKAKSVQDGVSIVRDTIADSPIIFDVSEDLVAGRVGVVGRNTLVLDLFKPVGFIVTRDSSTHRGRTFRAVGCNVRQVC